MKNKFPKIALAYLLIFMVIEWLVQLVLIIFTGTIINGKLSEIQTVMLTICMFIPLIVLLVFCLFRKIDFKELGLKPLKPLYWPFAFGLILLIETVIFISITWIIDFPNFSSENGLWKLNSVATIFGQPNTPPLFILNILLSMMMATIITIPQAMGEEIAWRGYLQNKFTDRFGYINGIIILGIIWGLFHFPINLAGFNFPNNRILGAFVFMTLNCVSLGAVFGWIRIKTNSVWPAAVAHAAYNAAETIIVMGIPKVNALLYNFYIYIVQLIIGIIFLRLISRITKKEHDIQN